MAVFNDVLVPWERVFLHADVARGNALFAETSIQNHTGHQTAIRGLARAHRVPAGEANYARFRDRHAPVLEQRALATLIDNGAYERHVRRVRRENERRRTALLGAISQYLPADAHVVGTAAGLQLQQLAFVAQIHLGFVLEAPHHRGRAGSTAIQTCTPVSAHLGGPTL